MSPDVKEPAKPGAPGPGRLQVFFWVGGAMLLYAVFGGLQAARVPLWLDEIGTYYMVRLPSLSRIWQALTVGVDQSLPLLFLLSRASVRLFGPGNLALRLPALAGFWLCCLCLFWFVRRRVGFPYALCALLFPLLTGAYGYAYDARSYGITLGCAGVALVSWQAAAEGRHRRLALAGIALGLGGALFSNFYAVLLAIPFAGAEAWRAYSWRRIDWPVWIAFAVSAVPMIVYPIILRAVGGWALWPAGPGDFPAFYSQLLTPVLVFLVISAAVLLLWRTGPRDPCSFPEHELLALALLALLPLPAIALSMAAHLPWFFRYGLPALIGVTGLFVVIAARGSRRAGWLLVTLLASRYVLENRGIAQPIPGARTPVLQKAFNSGEEIVFPSLHDFVRLGVYERPEFLGKAYFLLNREAMVRGTKSDLLYQIALRWSKWFLLPGTTVPEDAFLARHPRFIVYGQADDWLVQDLLRRGASLRLIDREGAADMQRLLFQADTAEPRVENTHSVAAN